MKEKNTNEFFVQEGSLGSLYLLQQKWYSPDSLISELNETYLVINNEKKTSLKKLLLPVNLIYQLVQCVHATFKMYNKVVQEIMNYHSKNLY